MVSQLVPYFELNLSCKILSSNAMGFLRFVANSPVLKNFYKVVDEDDLRMVIQVLDKQSVHTENLAQFSKTQEEVERAFSYIDWFFMDIDGAFFTEKGHITLKLKLKDEVIFNIFNRIRTDTIQRHNLFFREAVAFQAILAYNFKSFTVSEREMIKAEMARLNYFCKLNPEVKMERLKLFQTQKEF